MADKIEMSLDEIIKSQKRKQEPQHKRGGARRHGAQPNRGGSGGGNSGNLKRPSGGHTLKGRGGIQKAKFAGAKVNSAGKQHMNNAARRSVETAKLLFANLDYGVSDADLRELCGECGPLKKVAVHYDRSGRSLGTAEVTFVRRADALKAIKQYNGIPLDGRPMNIQLTTTVDVGGGVAQILVKHSTRSAPQARHEASAVRRGQPKRGRGAGGAKRVGRN